MSVIVRPSGSPTSPEAGHVLVLCSEVIVRRRRKVNVSAQFLVVLRDYCHISSNN